MAICAQIMAVYLEGAIQNAGCSIRYEE